MTPPRPALEGTSSLQLGTYSRLVVTDADSSAGDMVPSDPAEPKSPVISRGRMYFDFGLRLLFAYQHELAAKVFLACLQLSPGCALAHAMVALCHSPNYNFKGDAYYSSTDHSGDGTGDGDGVNEGGERDVQVEDPFPSQQVATKHARLGKEKANMHMRGEREPSQWQEQVSNVESDIIEAISVLTAHPGIDPAKAVDMVSRPYANAMKEVYRCHPGDADVAYFYIESLMVLNAWRLYEYPTGRPLTPDVHEIRSVLEHGLALYPEHAGLCHLYVHLSEMSDNPGKALQACNSLRSSLPDAGHLVHMATHIDVLLGDYHSVVRWNANAIAADHRAMLLFPDTAGVLSFYFGYSVHNYHMLVYGCILGGFEGKAMEVACDINKYLTEDIFVQNPVLRAYLESYAALDVHVLVRFGRWLEILQLSLPQKPDVMLYRSASLRYGRALAFANLGDIDAAKNESKAFDNLRADPQAEERILHNNTVKALLEVESPMIRGEIAYHEGRSDQAFKLLREAVQLQDELHYDEPWGKMQPIRHTLAGLLLEKGSVEESEQVFRSDLLRHPNNPWSLRGLIDCLSSRLKGGSKCCTSAEQVDKASPEGQRLIVEIQRLELLLVEQRKSEYADFEITKACMCCLPKREQLHAEKGYK